MKDKLFVLMLLGIAMCVASAVIQDPGLYLMFCGLIVFIGSGVASVVRWYVKEG